MHIFNTKDKKEKNKKNRKNYIKVRRKNEAK